MATLKRIREQLAAGDEQGQGLDGQGDNQDQSNDLRDDPTNKNKKDDSAPKKMRKMLQFRQYMRSENEDDRELMEEFIQVIEDTDDWEREDHLDDLRPAVWFRKGDHVAEVYASLGTIAVTFGYLPKEDGEEQDYTMMKPIFPPVVLPYEVEDEDTGEIEKDFDNAFEKLQEFLAECSEYIEETGQAEEDEKRSNNRAMPSLYRASTRDDQEEDI